MEQLRAKELNNVIFSSQCALGGTFNVVKKSCVLSKKSQRKCWIFTVFGQKNISDCPKTLSEDPLSLLF